VAYLSSAVPSFFAQYWSVRSFLASQSPALQRNTTLLAAVEKALGAVRDGLWETGLLSNLAVCGAWEGGAGRNSPPPDCGWSNVWFADGGYSDGISVALTLSQVQKKYMASEMEGAPASPPPPSVKLIMVNNNFYTNNANNVLQYFNTTNNQGVEPGGFLWPIGVTDDTPNDAPWMSQQIFGEYYDTETLTSVLESIEGTNLTTARLEGNTVTNAAFGVVEGTKVSILLLQINSNIPTFVIGPDTEAQIPNLVELAETIAGSEELRGRVEDFLSEDVDDDGGSTSSAAVTYAKNVAAPYAAVVIVAWTATVVAIL